MLRGLACINDAESNATSSLCTGRVSHGGQISSEVPDEDKPPIWAAADAEGVIGERLHLCDDNNTNFNCMEERPSNLLPYLARETQWDGHVGTNISQFFSCV